MLLEASNIRVSLPSDEGTAPVLDSVSLALAPGDFVDVAGPSGAGKSTLLRALARLLPGVQGTLVLDGVSAETIPAAEWRSRVALVPQKPAIFPGSVRENLLVGWRLKLRDGHRPPADEVLRECLVGVHLDVDLDRDAARLSVGQQARVCLLRVVLTEPSVLLLDEPDAALDELSAAAVTEVARSFVASGRAVVRVRHRMSDGAATRRLEIQAGRAREVDV